MPRENLTIFRIPIPHSKLNIKVWRRMLVDYPDYAICDLLEFGFPLDFQGTDLDYSSRRNHKGARDHTPYVSAYLSRECSVGRMAGPFPSNPFPVPLMVSPLNTVPKDNPHDRRVIVDLSWPPGACVNDGISKEFYLEQAITLRYTSVEEVCQMVLEVGQVALIYRIFVTLIDNYLLIRVTIAIWGTTGRVTTITIWFWFWVNVMLVCRVRGPLMLLCTYIKVMVITLPVTWTISLVSGLPYRQAQGMMILGHFFMCWVWRKTYRWLVLLLRNELFWAF